jgi:hypothetical protein
LRAYLIWLDGVLATEAAAGPGVERKAAGRRLRSVADDHDPFAFGGLPDAPIDRVQSTEPRTLAAEQSREPRIRYERNDLEVNQASLHEREAGQVSPGFLSAPRF